MPGTAYGLPATACIAGAKLARVPGTSCSVCYALKDRHVWTNPKKAQARRLASLRHPRWADAMVITLLAVHRYPTFRVDLGVKNAKARGLVRTRFNVSGFHRWHDSGDLQGEWHLDLICDVARRTPELRHWLPTQELGMVRRYLAAGGSIPDNLVVRVSSVMIDDPHTRAWPHTSSVSACVPAGQGHHACPAPKQANTCGTCRACWKPEVAHVVYELH